MGTELQTLLELRRQALGKAEAELAAALGEVDRRAEEADEARQHLVQAEARLAARKAGSPDRQGGGFSSGEWQQERRFQQRLHRECQQRAADVQEAALAQAEAEQAAEDTRRSVVDARREVEVLEKHRERVALRQRQEQSRRQEREADDLTSARFGRE